MFSTCVSVLKSSSFLFRLTQIGLVAIFLGLGWLTSLSSSEGPDEVAHYYYNRFVAKYGRLPLDEAERLEAGYKADLPPLSYLLVGMSAQRVDLESPPYLKVSRNNPRVQLVLGHSNITSWRIIPTEDPYRGEILLWYLGRWLTLGAGLAGLFLTYWLLRQINPDHPWLALGAVALLAFLPTYNYISGVTSYEPLTGALLAAYLLALFQTVHHPHRRWLYLALGLLMGLAALNRQTVWPATLAVPLLIVWLARRDRWPLRAVWARLMLFVVGLMSTFGLWLLYMVVYFNQIAELGLFQGSISPILIGDGSGRTSLQIAGLMTGGEIGLESGSKQNDSILQWMWRFFSGVWGSGWLAWLLLAIWLLALIGLARQWRRQAESERLWGYLLCGHLGLLLFFPFLRFLFSGEASTAMSQHLLFPAGAAIMVLFVWGLRAWFQPKYLAIILFVLAATYLWRSVDALAERVADRFPIRTVSLSNSEPAVATFGPMSLIDYTYRVDHQNLETMLNWRADELAGEDYRLELTLVDGRGQPQVRWLGQPLNGRYPTRAWTPQDRVRDVINLPLVGLPSGDYRLELRVLSRSGPVDSEDGPVKTLGRVGITSISPARLETVSLGGYELGYKLWPGVTTSLANDLPIYGENSTLVILVQGQEKAKDAIQLKLVGPDEQTYQPNERVGHVYLFNVVPELASGPYHLRFERRSGDKLVEQVVTEAVAQIETEARSFTVERPIAYPLQANFAGQVALLGYDLPQRRVQAGQDLPVTLHWQALREIGANLIMFNDLIDEQQQVWRGGDRQIRSVYSTMLWAPGEVVADPFTIQVDPNAPDGIYYLLVGLYLPVGESSVSLPLMQDGQFTEVTSVTLGPIKIGHAPPGLTVETAEPQIELNQPFGNTPNLTLLGYDLADAANQPITNYQLPITNLHLTLYWRSEDLLAVDYTTFVHLRDAAGKIIAQKDQPPLGGAYPTSLWEPGEIIRDEIIVPLLGELTSGHYQIFVGLYDFRTGQRLTVPGKPASEVRLVAFDVP